MKIDLRTCKKGDILISKHDLIVEYIEPLPANDYYDHKVYYPPTVEWPNGSYGTRTHDGRVFRNVRQPEDHDIVKIIHKKLKNNIETAVTKLQKYMNTYDTQYGYKDYRVETLMMYYMVFEFHSIRNLK